LAAALLDGIGVSRRDCGARVGVELIEDAGADRGKAVQVRCGDGAGASGVQGIALVEQCLDVGPVDPEGELRGRGVVLCRDGVEGAVGVGERIEDAVCLVGRGVEGEGSGEHGVNIRYVFGSVNRILIGMRSFCKCLW